MCSASGLYNFYHARHKRWQVMQERHYVQRKWAFGRMPLKIHLGDFLQLRPTAAMSLLTDMTALAHKLEEKQVPAEYQDAAKLFLATEHCYELTTTNHFRNDEGGRQLKDLIQFMRDPKPESSDEYKRVSELWNKIVVKNQKGGPSDPETHIDERFREPRFQQGHMLGMFWETCGPWMAMRAKHDALALHTPLFCLQAADQTTPRMDKKDAAKLLNHYNPHETGGMHRMFQVHLGMKVRLTDSLCKELGLVKDAEGVVVHISAHPDDEEMV